MTAPLPRPVRPMPGTSAGFRRMALTLAAVSAGVVARPAVIRALRGRRAPAPGQVLRHELRTPVSALTSLTAALAADDDDPRLAGADRRELSRLAYWQACHLSALLDGAHAATPTASLEELVTASGVAAGLPRERLDARLGPAAATMLERRRVQQILTNLLTNAAQHGAADGVVAVAARLHAGRLTISVVNRIRPGPAQPGSRLGLKVVRTALAEVGGSLTVSRTARAVLAEVHLPA